MIIQDFLSRTIFLSNTPQRIVSLVPSQTELLVYLGLEKYIVGITKFCVHPPSLRNQKVVVGGTKKVDFEKIKALRPDLILCNKEENTAAMVKSLETIAPVHVSEIFTLEDNYRLIEEYGMIFNVISKAINLNQLIKSKHKALQNQNQGKPKIKVAYFIWKNPWIAVGKNTFIDDILTINNFKNVYQQQRYPEVDIHDLPKVDFILLSSEPYPFQEKHFKELPVESHKIKLVNGEYFSWYGSRMLLAFDYFLHLRLS